MASDTDKPTDGALEQLGKPQGESAFWTSVEPGAPVDFVSPRDDSIIGFVAVFLLMLFAYLHHIGKKDDSKPKAA